MSEKRIDLEDKCAYTWAEYRAYYQGTYSLPKIKEFWEYCPLAKVQKDASAKAKAKVKAKAKAKTKVKAASAKAKAKNVVVPEGPGGLCIAGESLIDMLPRETANGEACFMPCPGGAPFNALLAARRLGIPTSYLASLSKDMFGEQLYGLLENEGVNLEHVSRFDRPTTLAFVSRKAGEGEKYAFFKENAADRALKQDDVKKVLRKNRYDVIHMSLGAVTLEDKGMAEAFFELYRTAGDHGSLRTFDPNLRSNMIKGSSDSYRKKIEALVKHLDVVKSSDDDIAYLYGDSVKYADVAKKWLGMGPRLVIVTCGAKGAIAFPKDWDKEIPMPPPGTQPNTVNDKGQSSPVIDTVGAGDTFMGSTIQGLVGTRKYEFSTEAPLLEQLKKGKAWDEDSVAHLRDVLERAALAAAINCSRAGCNPPSSEEVNAAGKALNLAFAKEL